MKYQHLFFDLDHTLWDFEKNSREALGELYRGHDLQSKGISTLEGFLDRYQVHNDELWDLYRRGGVSKDQLRTQRFLKTLIDHGIDDATLASQLDVDYVNTSPKKGHLVPNALEVLEEFAQKFQLHIITNGFSEIQKIKLETSGLDGFFENLITSDGVGVQKPHPKIFSQALVAAGAKRKESLMIGDHLEVDVYGAMGIGMDAVYYNPKGKPVSKKPTFEISDLGELLSLL